MNRTYATEQVEVRIRQEGERCEVVLAHQGSRSSFVLDAGLQFKLELGGKEAECGQREQITALDCQLLDVQLEEQSDKRGEKRLTAIWLRLEEQHGRFSAIVHYELLAGKYMRKTLAITPLGSELGLYAVTVAAFHYEGQLQRGGEGQPALLGGEWFAGIAFPGARSVINANRCEFSYLICKRIQNEETWESFPFVCGAGFEEEGVKQSLIDYFHLFGPRQLARPAAIYCDWGLHDELSDAIELTEAMTLQMLGHLEAVERSHGIKFDYYLIDAFWFAENGCYIDFKQPHWPQGLAAVKARMAQLGLKLGLWFDVNGKFLRMQGMEDARIDRGQEALCLGDERYWQLLRAALLHQIREHGMKLVKFDFAEFSCSNPDHDHPQGIASRSYLLGRFLALLEEARRAEPELVILGYNGFTADYSWIKDVDAGKEGQALSPWWALYLDYIYCGDPRPSELPAWRLRDSIHSYTDAMIRQFAAAWVPYRQIDDHGVMIGNTGTIYSIGKEGWRNDWVLSFSRGNRKRHVYGDLALLDESDYGFMKMTWQLTEEAVAGNYRTSPILGNPLREEVYGYANGNGEQGYITLVNPHPVAREVELSLPEWSMAGNGEGLRIVQVYGGEQWLEPDKGQTQEQQEQQGLGKQGRWQGQCRGRQSLTLPPFEVAMFRWSCLSGGGSYAYSPAGAAEGLAEPSPGLPALRLAGEAALPLPSATIYPVLPYTEMGRRGELTLPLPGGQQGERYLVAQYRDGRHKPLRTPRGQPDGITLHLAAAGSFVPLEPLYPEAIWSGISWMVYRLPAAGKGEAADAVLEVRLAVPADLPEAIHVKLELWRIAPCHEGGEAGEQREARP